MPDDVLVTSIERQFACTHDTLREAVQNCPADQWRVARHGFFLPARLAFHLVQATDFHLHADRSSYDWNRFGIDWQEASPEQLPSPFQLLEYLDEVHAKVNRRMDELGPAGLLTADYHGTFPTGLDHVLYALRHAQHHTGQINAELKIRGVRPAEWR